YWTDIGNIYSFFEANLDLTRELPSFNLFDSDRTIYTRSRMLPPSKYSGTTLENALVAEGAIIHAAKIESSVIGIRSRIGMESILKSVYMMGSDYYETLEDILEDNQQGIPMLGIGSRCNIRNTIIDKNCRIGDDVKINGGTRLENTDHPLYSVKDGIVVIKKGSIIPNGFVI
ncbi:MAG: glucose-1-phosphate adenylyltransferase, partial [Chitinophagaceae bacterium]